MSALSTKERGGVTRKKKKKTMMNGFKRRRFTRKIRGSVWNGKKKGGVISK